MNYYLSRSCDLQSLWQCCVRSAKYHKLSKSSVIHRSSHNAVCNIRAHNSNCLYHKAMELSLVVIVDAATMQLL